MYDPGKPLILQSDKSILLEVEHPEFEAARDFLSRFAELEKSPEYVHTYRISNLSLWNAAASGIRADEVLDGLARFSKFPIPQNVEADIRDTFARYGRLKLLKFAGDVGTERSDGNDAGAPGDGAPTFETTLVLTADDPLLMRELLGRKSLQGLLGPALDDRRVLVPATNRGLLKQALIKLGHPVEDLVGHVPGAPLSIELRATTRGGRPFSLRPYQKQAVDAFWAGGGVQGGSGVIVLPCGAGKTVVGLAAMARVQAHTLILCTNTTAVRQWIAEILDKTTLTEDEVGEYSGHKKQVRPVTVATYHILTERKRRGDEYPHFRIFNAQDWGLIIYDEVHLLPAPVFRITAEIQARRRLGLTATLVREDGKEDDVFSLIGPKKYDAPWKDLEQQGWIATATCTELRVPLDRTQRERYAAADAREQFRLASENPLKEAVVEDLVARHRAAGDRVLVIGRFVDQLHRLAQRLKAPVLSGQTPQHERERLFEAFRSGAIDLLIVSNVANFAVDLPEASVAIEVSGTYGSRQEEAQRLG
ncbi:MAG TPA: DNA repair helicase XPB, partial [Bacillota bacterium]